MRVDDIGWIEVAGHDATLHVGERLHRLRETMAGIEDRLDAQRSARVHRSAIVDLDRERGIVPLDSADARAQLHGRAPRREPALRARAHGADRATVRPRRVARRPGAHARRGTLRTGRRP